MMLRDSVTRRQSVAHRSLEIATTRPTHFHAAPTSARVKTAREASPSGVRTMRITSVGLPLRLPRLRMLPLRSHRSPLDALARLARLGTCAEEHAAGRRQVRLVPDHAGRDPIDVGDIGTTEPERIRRAGLLLVGRVGLSRARQHQRRKPDREQQRKRKTP